MKGITALLTDSNDPASLAGRARRRRWEQFCQTFPDIASMSVIDLGGVVTEWALIPTRPAKLTVVNIFDQASDGRTEVVVGDACALPAEVTNQRFDLVFSNSVIDQVGGHFRRMQFAENVRTLGPRHWIQTAYRYFPIDSETLFPVQQLLPLRTRAAVTRHWPLGHRHADSERDSVLLNLGIEGLSKTAFSAYFPDSEIVTERAFGLVKSLIAVKR